MEETKTSIAVWSNNPLLEKIFHGNNLHLRVDFKSYHERLDSSYVLALIDLNGDLTEVSQKIISIYDNCRESRKKLAVTLLHKGDIDTEKNIYFTTLLDGLSAEKPLHRLIVVRDLYQTGLVTPITWLDTFLATVMSERIIEITTKGENFYYPLSFYDFTNGLLKAFFLANTAGKTFWLIGDAITDLDLAYLIKRKLENVDSQEFEINADTPNSSSGIHIATLGIQTAASLNWEAHDDFYEAIVEITKKVGEDNQNLKNELTHPKQKTNKTSKAIYDILTTIEITKRRILNKKITISNQKIQDIYIHKAVETVILFIIISYSLSSVAFFVAAAQTLKISEKSINSLRTGDTKNSVNYLKQAKMYYEIGKYSYGIISPVIRLVSIDINEKNSNLLSLVDCILNSLGNAQQTFVIAEKIYNGIKGDGMNLKYEDASLALKSNLSQVYENLNQIELLTMTGKIPLVIESEIIKNTEFQNISNLKQQVINTIKAVDIIPSILVGDTAKNIAILFQNTEELHGTGGRIDYLIVIVLEKGKLISYKIYSSADINSLSADIVSPPSVLNQVLGSENWQFQDINYNPDYPKTASNVSWYLEKNLRFKPDAIITVNNTLIQDLITIDKDISFPTEGETGEQLTYYVEKLLTGKLPMLTVGEVVSKNIGDNQIYYWSADKNAQSSIADQSYAGTILSYRCHPGLFKVPNCISQTTYLNETSLSLSGIQNKHTRTLTHKVTFTQEKIDHEYLLDYKSDEKKIDVIGQNIKIYQLYISAPSELKSVFVDGQPVATPGMTKQTDLNIDRYQIPLVLNEDPEHHISIRFTTPLPKNSTNQVGYSLTEYRQSGITDSGTKLEISYPETLKASTITSSVELGPNKFSYTYPSKTSTFGVSFVPNQP